MPDSLPRLILASASPRRRELLALLGIPFNVVPSAYDEPPGPDAPTSLPDFVTPLAANKAMEVAQRSPDSLVIGADTIVALSQSDVGVPLGKPADAADAERMLRLLSGNVHSVYTGVVLLRTREPGQIDAPIAAAVRTRVRFRAMNDRMIADYIATGEVMDKAGAYGAQGYAAPFIESFDGDFFNVVGLPLCTVGRLLEQAGVEWWRLRRGP